MEVLTITFGVIVGAVLITQFLLMKKQFREFAGLAQKMSPSWD